MISCQIKNIKDFMGQLLKSDTFDNFSFVEGQLMLGYTVTFDGHINSDFYSGEELPQGNFLSWGDMRPVIFEHMKGKHMPLSFQFVMHAPAQFVNTLIAKHALSIDPSVVTALVVTIRFDHGKLSVITGTAFSTFILDKTLDAAWDSSFKKSLDSKSIAYEEVL